jgi:hypothetical protein
MAAWIGESKGLKSNFTIEMLGSLRSTYPVRKPAFLSDKVANEYIFLMAIWKTDAIRFGIWHVEVQKRLLSKKSREIPYFPPAMVSFMNAHNSMHECMLQALEED